MTLPPPGWYPDPEQPARQRWWSGDKWTAGLKEAEGAAAYVPMVDHPAAPEERVVVPRPVGTRSSRAKQANYPSWVGLVIGLASLLYNPFALVSLPGFLVSTFGLIGAILYKRRTGKFTGGFFALGGIALAIITFAIAWPEIQLFLQLRNGLGDLPIDIPVPTVPTPFPSN